MIRILVQLLKLKKMFSEMVGWAVDEGADILIGETFYYAEEAYAALKSNETIRTSQC